MKVFMETNGSAFCDKKFSSCLKKQGPKFCNDKIRCFHGCVPIPSVRIQKKNNKYKLVDHQDRSLGLVGVSIGDHTTEGPTESHAKDGLEIKSDKLTGIANVKSLSGIMNKGEAGSGGIASIAGGGGIRSLLDP
ncbi:uncharacterized protein LOC118437471 [Folsomia candida]|uniref:uncharacterized protein LOC118437471 n=1 Tax=Folsomia candida TaxID=158441 RepID=UPI001604FFBD|nr:uncharacterized protein LOC118437471 [Folsomia candida]